MHMQDDLNHNKPHRKTAERKAPRRAQLPRTETRRWCGRSQEMLDQAQLPPGPLLCITVCVHL